MTSPSVPSTEPAPPVGPSAEPAGGARDVWIFGALACGVTWALAFPLALAWMQRRAPTSGVVSAAGLSAFGPSLAALAVAGRRRQLRALVGRWRARPAWIALALVTPALVHVVATALHAAAGDHPARWLHPPDRPEALAALVVFPLGEELGWRGFAHPRLAARFGVVPGSLLLGGLWAVWHLAYGITPEAGRFDLLGFGMMLLQLPLYSVVIAWLFERTGRSLLVAIAFHAGAHLDRMDAAHGRLGLHVLHTLVVGALAVVAARALAGRPRERR